MPLNEAIQDCTELLYSGRYHKPPVDRQTFIELVSLCSCNVVLLTNDGFYRQVDGLAMGSPPAPQLENDWMSKFDERIKGNSTLDSRYMDDILRDIKKNQMDSKLDEINNLHLSLKFTVEREKNLSISFLDMENHQTQERLTSTWYTKPTDTDLMMNFYAMAPVRYKRSVVSGLIHRIFRSCSNWINFHEILNKGKTLLENNQYPKSFYDPIISNTLTKILEKTESADARDKEKEEEEETKMIFLAYRGKVSEKFESLLRKIKAPVKVVFVLKKLKTLLPSLKPNVEKPYKSGVVYKIECPRCKACYVG